MRTRIYIFRYFPAFPHNTHIRIINPLQALAACWQAHFAQETAFVSEDFER